ncbi:hypothetical protein ACET3X_002667 [Alternaria dauci]|uniref:Myb-like domain-containing protein n=1 Tax=Alternaria dauci TaxID=48095 RepID=A0ABR3UQ73_9PLEO
MADANGIPRRVSIAYILGFSKKPYKEVPTPGHIVEWTASDGRKGKLTGAGKPRLTAASLAKVPSDKRSTKEALDAKSASKKSASTKPAIDVNDPWGGNTNWPNTSAKDDSKKSDSNKDGGWPVGDAGNGDNDPLQGAWDNTGDASGGDKNANASAWDITGATPSGDNKTNEKRDEKKDEKKDEKTDEKKDETTPAQDTPTNAPTGPEACDNPAPASEGEKKDEGTDAWTKEQDAKLIQMKTETSKSWAEISKEIDGKSKDECTERFRKIKPNDWKPNDANQRGESKGGKGKKGKENKQNHNQNQRKGANGKDQKKDDNKEDEKKNEASEVADVFVGGLFPDTFGGDADDKNKKKDDTTVADPCTSTAPAPNSLSKQVPSQTVTPHKTNDNTQPIATRPFQLEVKPDDTFSADDLRLVARILQQDCTMVWNRVSWRFKDKTGRTLHPDVFEKKITGRLEGKDGEKGGWKK